MLTRKKPLKRGKAPKRRKPISRKGKRLVRSALPRLQKRIRAKGKPRFKRGRDPQYLEWIRGLTITPSSTRSAYGRSRKNISGGWTSCGGSPPKSTRNNTRPKNCWAGLQLLRMPEMSPSKAGVILFLAAVVVAVPYGYSTFAANKEYERTIGSYWSLSERASTLDMKADYLNHFMAAVDSAHLTGNDAILYPTPQNSVEQNITTAKSLQARMNEIRGTDVTSFQYQQAISQITAQEQGEAGQMLEVIEGRWFLSHHPLLWRWIAAICWVLIVGCGIAGAVCVLADD